MRYTYEIDADGREAPSHTGYRENASIEPSSVARASGPLVHKTCMRVHAVFLYRPAHRRTELRVSTRVMILILKTAGFKV